MLIFLKFCGFTGMPLLFSVSMYETFLGNLVFNMIFMINIVVALGYPFTPGGNLTANIHKFGNRRVRNGVNIFNGLIVRVYFTLEDNHGLSFDCLWANSIKKARPIRSSGEHFPDYSYHYCSLRADSNDSCFWNDYG